jgi:hypothetical protein
MLILSEVLIQYHDLESYADLVTHIQHRAREGEMFIDLDIKPPYPDTPEEWENDLEAKFTSPTAR